MGAGQSRHVSEERVSVKQLKHTTTLFNLSDHYILSRKWKVFVDQVQTNYHGRPIWCYNQSGVIELLIVRDPHYGRVCFKSVKTLGALHSQLWNKPRLYPIENLPCTTYVLQVYRMCVAIHILCEQIRYRRWWRWWRGRWNWLTFRHLSSKLDETPAYLVFFNCVKF